MPIYKEKRNQKRNQNGCTPRLQPQLTKSEALILHLLQSDPFASSKTLAERYKQGTTGQYIRRVRSKLRKNGLLPLVAPPLVAQGGDPATPATKSATTGVRLHALKFRIQLINPVSEKYLRDYNKSIFVFRGCHVQCFTDSICIQGQQLGFWGSSEDTALEEAMTYFMPFFRALEWEVGTMLVKNRKNNIKMTYDEYATNPSSTAQEAIKKGNHIRIFADDGKLRFTSDNSMGLEHETHHAQTSKPDSEQYKKHIIDFMDHPEAPTLSQISKLLGNLIQENRETAAGLNAVVQLLSKPKLHKEVPSTAPPGYVV